MGIEAFLHEKIPIENKNIFFNTRIEFIRDRKFIMIL